MKKTIFKGTINGQEFNSVQEYNKAMMKALTAGEQVDAQASTKTVDDDEEGCECNGECNGGCQCHCKPKVEYIPYFDSTGKEYHLTITDLIDNSKDLTQLLKDVKTNLENKFPLIDRITDKWDSEDLRRYGEELNIALGMLDETLDANKCTEKKIASRAHDTKKQIEELNKQLKLDSGRLEYLNKSEKVLSELELFYVAVKDVILEKYRSNHTRRPVAKAPETTATMKEPQKEITISAEELRDFVNGLLGNLLK